MDEAIAAAVRALVSADGMLAVRATPKAAAERIAVADGQVRVWVTAPPDKGKANKAVTALVAKTLSVPKGAVNVVRGETAREKMLRVQM